MSAAGTGTAGSGTAGRSDSALAQAGIDVRRYQGSTLVLGERTGVTLARVQSLGTSDAQMRPFTDCGVPLPGRVDRCAGQDPTALCLAPGDWLLFSEFLDFGRLTDQLVPAVDHRQSALIDVSAAMAVFRLTGGAAPWLLQKLCGLDIVGVMSRGQRCARTRLDHAAVILHHHQPRTGAGPFVWDILFDRSLARWLWQNLLLSAPHAEELHSRHGTPS